MITLVPVGTVDRDFMEIIQEYARIFFCMEVEIGEEIDTSIFKLRQTDELPQLKTGDVFKHLKQYKRPDQFCILGVTMKDLYPYENFNFCYGEAQILNKLGLFSFCRHVPRWWNFSSYDDIELYSFAGVYCKKFLKRSLETVAHEIGHLFGITHCVYFECMMNGVNHDEERDRSPGVLCPICQRKLAAGVNKELNCYDPIERCMNLIDFFEKHGLTEQVEILQNVLCISQIENGNLYEPKVGDIIRSTADFESYSKIPMPVNKGMTMTVEYIDEDGDIAVSHENWETNEWIYKEAFSMLEAVVSDPCAPENKTEIEFEVGQEIVFSNGEKGILQRFIPKTNRWRIKLSDDKIIKKNAEELRSLIM